MADNIANKKKGKFNKIVILIAALLLVAAIAGSVFFIKSHGGLKNNSSSVSSQPEDFIISTPVGDLKYPAEWSQSVELEINSDKAPYSATLYGIVNKAEIPLFTISIGDGGQGFLLGTLTDENGVAVELRIDIPEIEQKDNCTEEELQRLHSMQDRVNDIIEQLYSLEGFESVNSDEH